MGDRRYRARVAGGDLRTYPVRLGESDLLVSSTTDRRAEILPHLRRLRAEIERAIADEPAFATSLVPIRSPASGIAVRMIAASERAGVGPMAAVAGAIAWAVGEGLREAGEDAIIENGGDIYIASRVERIVAIFAGPSPFSMRIGIRIPADRTPIAVCTSSGTVGPSLSFGKADAVAIAGRDGALADAAATAIANRVKAPGDLEDAVGAALAIEGVEGAVAIVGDRLAARGAIELVEV
ncbi:MAG: UPF0280 family protein [Planctomycetes bacterium]|nr:UPF0280 family protein [Planctomycetota bacterium]